MSEADIQKVAKMVRLARKVVVLTGAGISVESGIPDFRSPGGLWTRYDPTIYGTFESFMNDPTRFWSMAVELHPLLESAKPNPAHLAVSELERMGKCDAVITQNIDDLHQAAGSTEVLELHGTYRNGTCITCSTRHEYDDMRQSGWCGEVPSCKNCGGTIKPDVVLFGEPLNASVLNKAIEHASTCDLMLVIGCGLEVFPAASLPTYARRNNAMVVFFNIASTAFDEIADVILLGKAGEVMPEVVEAYRSLCKVAEN